MTLGTVITFLGFAAVTAAAIYALVTGWPPGPNDRK
jgi:hypothetical protein